MGLGAFLCDKPLCVTSVNKYISAESVTLVFSGENYFETLEEIIDSAKETIHLQTYIFEEDDTGNRIAAALVNAAQRNVKVFVIADGFGSNSLSGKFVKYLRFSGINFRFFAPVFSSESIYFGRRLHHKVIVADKKIALVGGINIADKYHGTKINAPWLDYAVLIKGEACAYLHHLCENLYLKKSFSKKRKKALFDGNLNGEYLIRFRRNDWILKKNEIHHSYREALTKAENSVIIIASYFLPGFLFRRVLRRTGKRGIEITIILTGKSDVRFIRNAEKFLYGFLLRNRIKIYEWPNSMMHGKAIIVDNGWATIGSYNLNQLSHYRSIELNVDIKNEKFVESFRSHLEKVILKECIEITKENFSHAGIFSQLLNFFSYHYVRLITNVFFSGKLR